MEGSERRAKDIILKVVPSKISNAFIRKHHYSGKVVNNSSLHFGVFLNGRMHGAMSYGPPLDKRKLLGTVEDTGWNEMLELNRMAFDDYLPKHSESRAIGISLQMIKKQAPQIKWVISFADATSCGDGTIYRASNFHLIDIKTNKSLYQLPDGTTIHDMTLQSNPMQPRPELGGRSLFDITGGKYSMKEYMEITGAKPMVGFQLKYIYFIDKTAKDRLTVPIMPFSKIDEMGAGMYRGEKR